ncbi:MAG: polyprenyl synthetase family protein [Flavobacteriales bacterium]
MIVLLKNYTNRSFILPFYRVRIRPVLCLTKTHIFQNHISKALLPSLVLEFFHNFTLIHEDVMDPPYPGVTPHT